MSTARLSAIEECIRKRSDRVMEINQQQQRKLELRIGQLEAESTTFADNIDKKMDWFLKKHQYTEKFLMDRNALHHAQHKFFYSKPAMKSPSGSRYMAVIRSNNVVQFPTEKAKINLVKEPHHVSGNNKLPSQFTAAGMLPPLLENLDPTQSKRTRKRKGYQNGKDRLKEVKFPPWKDKKGFYIQTGGEMETIREGTKEDIMNVAPLQKAQSLPVVWITQPAEEE